MRLERVRGQLLADKRLGRLDVLLLDIERSRDARDPLRAELFEVILDNGDDGVGYLDAFVPVFGGCCRKPGRRRVTMGDYEVVES